MTLHACMTSRWAGGGSRGHCTTAVVCDPMTGPTRPRCRASFCLKAAIVRTQLWARILRRDIFVLGARAVPVEQIADAQGAVSLHRSCCTRFAQKEAPAGNRRSMGKGNLTSNLMSALCYLYYTYSSIPLLKIVFPSKWWMIRGPIMKTY